MAARQFDPFLNCRKIWIALISQLSLLNLMHKTYIRVCFLHEIDKIKCFRYFSKVHWSFDVNHFNPAASEIRTIIWSWIKRFRKSQKFQKFKDLNQSNQKIPENFWTEKTFYVFFQKFSCSVNFHRRALKKLEILNLKVADELLGVADDPNESKVWTHSFWVKRILENWIKQGNFHDKN